MAAPVNVEPHAPRCHSLFQLTTKPAAAAAAGSSGGSRGTVAPPSGSGTTVCSSLLRGEASSCSSRTSSVEQEILQHAIGHSAAIMGTLFRDDERDGDEAKLCHLGIETARNMPAEALKARVGEYLEEPKERRRLLEAPKKKKKKNAPSFNFRLTDNHALADVRLTRGRLDQPASRRGK